MKRRTLLTGALAGAAGVALPGCARFYYGSAAAGGVQTDLLEFNQKAADMLLQGAPLDPRQPVLVSTLVHLDRLNESSRLGRLCSEQIAGRLVQRGVRVTELKLRENLVMRPGDGELLLSREVREVSRAQAAQAVVVGTYAATPQTVYVSLKLVSPEGNAVMAAYDYALPVDADIRILLAMR